MKKFKNFIVRQKRYFSKTNKAFLNLNEIPLTSFYPATPDKTAGIYPEEISFQKSCLENGVTLNSSVLNY
jgi:hypothetical protein